jgi:TRAP-type C4-dicarboxylate transport system permease small subunit
MILTAVDIGARSLTGRSVPGLLETGEILLVMLVYLGLAYGQQTRAHVAVSLVTAQLSPRLAKAAVATGLTVAIFVVAWLVYATGATAIDSVIAGETRYGIAAVPVWPARVVVPIGLSLLAFEFMADIRETVTGRAPVSDVPVAEKEVLA